MKRTMRSLLAMCLTLVLLASILPMGAMAIEAEDKGSIVVSNLDAATDGKTDTGATVKVYQLMTVEYDYDADQPVVPVYKWVDSVANWLKNHGTYSIFVDGENGNAVTDAFYETSLESDTAAPAYNSDIALFFDQMVNEIGSSLTAVDTKTGNCTFENLDMGYYLVLITDGMKIYRPSTVKLVPEWNEKDKVWEMTEAELVIKASEPGIKKELKVGQTDANDANVTDTITYTLKTDVPVYPENATAKGYKIGDKLPEGVTLNTNSITVYGVKGTTETQLTAGTAYTLDASAATTEKGNDIDFLLTFTYEQIRTYEDIKVTYTATVNKDVTLGTAGEEANKNTAYLAYNNNPYDAASWQEKSAEQTFYSFGIQVTKLDEKNEALAGAEFTLSKEGEELKFEKDAANDRYYLSDADAADTKLEVGEDGEQEGILNIHGLVPGEYVLTETKAPDGYVKLQNPITITITEDTATEGAVSVAAKDSNSATATETDESGIVKLEVKNVKGFTLPVTGGAGTMLFSIIGVLMMGGGVLLLLAIARKFRRAN